MLDHEQLLEPISQDSPCGEDLSFSPEFDAIAEARRADDPTLAQGAWQTELKTADWPAVIETGNRLLQERSKDLRIVVWLTEAHTQIEGFAGLAWGYRLTSRLCERFWDELFPREEEDDDGTLRTGHIRWLLTHSERWMRTLPLTRAPEGYFSANDFQAAHQYTSEDDAARTGRPTPEQVDAARQATAFEFYNDLATVLPDCLAALAELQTVVDDKAGDDAPGFRPCRETLEQVADMVGRFVRGSDTAAASDQQEPAAGESGPGTGAAPPAMAAAATINSRREALAQLRQVAVFFRRTEPQSPVAYLADKAAKWGEMPLHVWLRRVIKDDGALAHVEELLDVAPDRTDDNG